VGENKRFSDIFRVKNIINALIGFIETKVELYKIQFKEEIAKALSVLVMFFLLSMIGLLFVLFLSHFISILLNDLLDSQYFGYLIVTVLYLFIGIAVYYNRSKIKVFMTNMMFPEEETENDDEDEK